MSFRPPGRLESDLTKFSQAIQQLGEGRTNCAGTFTLSAGVTSTTVPAPNVAPGTVIFLAPETLAAAAALASTYVKASDVSAGSFVVTHANAASLDRTFGFVGLG